MPDTENHSLLPLDALLIDGADVGATMTPNGALMTLSALPERSQARRASPLNVADFSGEVSDVPAIPQPRGVSDLSDFRHALGAQAIRAVFSNRREVAKIDGDKRSSDSYKTELRVKPAAQAWREVARASADLAVHEAQVQGATIAHLAVGEPEDARGSAFDAEARSFLRSLSSAERLAAMRQDSSLLRAALRSPTLAGLSAEERPLADAAWRRHRDDADPAAAQRIAEGEERCRWARTAIDACAKVLIGETTSSSDHILHALDVADRDRLGALVEVVGSKFAMRRAS
jgi:hypothetical protein